MNRFGSDNSVQRQYVRSASSPASSFNNSAATSSAIDVDSRTISPLQRHLREKSRLVMVPNGCPFATTTKLGYRDQMLHPKGKRKNWEIQRMQAAGYRLRRSVRTHISSQDAREIDPERGGESRLGWWPVGIWIWRGCAPVERWRLAGFAVAGRARSGGFDASCGYRVSSHAALDWTGGGVDVEINSRAAEADARVGEALGLGARTQG